MVLFSSFAPTGGSIKKVSVYQSEFGKKKMEEELVNGPVEIFKKYNINILNDLEDS